MTIADQVRCSIDDFENGTKFESSLLHACTAIDGTARKLYGTQKGNRNNYISCLRNHYWLLEPMLGSINLVETKFSWGRLTKTDNPDLAEIIYEAFRCNHAHGSEQPLEITFIECIGSDITIFQFEEGKMVFPDRIIFALLSIAVLSKVNRDQTIHENYFLTLGIEKFVINEWWGREDDFKTIAKKYNTVRVKLNF